MSTPFLFVLMCLVSFRLTWFIVEDSFPLMEASREVFIKLQQKAKIRNNPVTHEREYYGWKSWPAELITCYWCVSVWVSALVIALTNEFTSLSLPFLWWGAVAGGSALICKIADRE